MTEIKSLKRIVEAAHDVRYNEDIAKAKDIYKKAREADNTYKYTPWFLSPGGKKTAEAHHDYHSALDSAEARHKAAKQGLVTKQDNDETKFEAAKAKFAAVHKAKQEAGGSPVAEDKPGIIRRVAGTVADHPLIAVGTVAGIAGLAALQKRKKRLPEPGSYNQGV
jgi:hypothetical protein